jgi:hypothetical protein
VFSSWIINEFLNDVLRMLYISYICTIIVNMLNIGIDS